jgi:hypothetical protein
MDCVHHGYSGDGYASQRRPAAQAKRARRAARNIRNDRRQRAGRRQS